MGDKLICITKNRKAMKIIILHDADARIEYLDVADHLLGSDIEEFLTRQGFSVNNITWLVTSADHIPVVYHKYDIDCNAWSCPWIVRSCSSASRLVWVASPVLQSMSYLW